MSKVVSILSFGQGLNKTESPPGLSEKRVSQWEDLMRKFSESHREQCKSVPLDIPRAPRNVKMFPTGSQYEGTWDVLGMSGYGYYCFPDDVLYEGEVEDGMFDGLGELRYQDGTVLRGKWKDGVLVDRTLMFADGLEYTEDDWKYCKLPDRRFTIEYDNGLQPADQSFLTPGQPTRHIPLGYYDTEDGFYDPKTKVIYKWDDPTAILRSPSLNEQKWIVANCRVNPDLPVGPRRDLYEAWTKAEEEAETPPPPASSGKRQSTKFRSMSVYDNDLEIEITFRNLEEDTTDSSSDSEY